MTRYLIVGNGAAGVTAAETIRGLDRDGEIVVVSAESHPMYSRPGLAYVIINEVPAYQVIARTRQWYADQRIKLIHSPAIKLNRATQSVNLADGTLLLYDKLLIATGARAVPAPYPNGDLDGVVYLDTLDGTRHLLKKAKRARRAIIVGGGITALEMTEGIAHQGVDTHYFLRRGRLWSRVFNETEAKILERKMHHHGITIHYNTDVSDLIGNWRGRVKAAQLKNGALFKCDLFGVGIGVRPQLDLVAESGLDTDRGILVDEYLRTSDPHIFAAGDCAQIYDRWSGRHLLDSLWPSAVASGRAAGQNMAGTPTPYIKGIPFNSALLFGLHITAIGQVNPRPSEGDNIQQAQSWSRGASEVWYTFPRNYSSAWAHKGDNSLRLVLDGTQLVGALIVGEQVVADPLRDLVEWEIDATPLLPYLDVDREVLQEQIVALWQRQKEARCVGLS